MKSSYRGKGSLTRMLNQCKTQSANPSDCINKFVNIKQYQPTWYNLYSTILNGEIETLAIGPDGKVYAVGQFTNGTVTVAVNGSVTVTGDYYVAVYDGITKQWSQLGTGFNNYIRTIAISPDGNIYIAGSFTNGVTSTTGQNYVSVYNGTSWSQLGTNFNGGIYTLAIGPDGKVYTSGTFTNSSVRRYVAVYDGNSWSQVGGDFNSTIRSIATDPDGKIYTAGYFTNGTGTGTGKYVAVYDGTSWSQLGTSVFNNNIYTLAIGPDRKVYVGGDFKNDSNLNYVAVYDGITKQWSQLGSSFNGSIRSIGIGNGNTVYTSGVFTSGAGKYITAYR